jgi:hypothetical protein
MGLEESDRVGSSLSTPPEEEVLLWTGLDDLSLSHRQGDEDDDGDRPAAATALSMEESARDHGNRDQQRREEESASGEHHKNDDKAAIDDWVCPICLNEVSFVETAIIKDCNHLFCATCILNWVLFKQEARGQAGFREALGRSPSSLSSQNNKCICPTCRTPFDMLCTYRHLDGTLSDTLLEENVCLLLRADWFDSNKFANWKGKAESPSSTTARKLYGADDYMEAAAYDNDYHDYEEDYYDDYHDMHSYHGKGSGKGRSMKSQSGGDGFSYSSAAASSSSSSSSRLIIGNRRWGKEGYVAGSRMYATPSSSGGGGGSSSTSSHGGGSGSSDNSSSKGKGRAKENMGRRAKRNTKRNAMDRAVV